MFEKVVEELPLALVCMLELILIESSTATLTGNIGNATFHLWLWRFGSSLKKQLHITTSRQITLQRQTLPHSVTFCVLFMGGGSGGSQVGRQKKDSPFFFLLYTPLHSLLLGFCSAGILLRNPLIHSKTNAPLMEGLTNFNLLETKNQRIKFLPTNRH